MAKTDRDFVMLEGAESNMTFSANMTLNVTGNATTDSSLEFELLVHPNTALLSMTLTLFTFCMAYYFKTLRNKKILGRTVS